MAKPTWKKQLLSCSQAVETKVGGGEASKSRDKRDREVVEESRASSSIGACVHSGQESERTEQTLPEQPSSKISRARGESKGEVVSEVVNSRPVSNDEARMVVAIDYLTLEDEKDAFGETKTPMMLGGVR